MTWTGTRSTSDTFLVGIRQGTDSQYQVGVLGVRKRPGHPQACSATLYLHQEGMPRGEGLTLTTSEPRWTSEAGAWAWDTSQARKGARFHVTMSLRTNGHCQWVVVLSGPRVGEPELA
jgi:hypothetical protein